jgi:hypothetical protein
MFSSLSMAPLLCAASLVAFASLTACSSPEPTAPTIRENANLAGVWINPANDYRWTLVQSGTTVTGTGSGAHRAFGVPITGTLTGSVAGDTFTFSETQSWTLASGLTEVEELHADEMRVTRESMTGIVTFLPHFPPFRSISGLVTMVRIVRAS